MDSTSWEKIPRIKPGQRLTAEERIEYLKNNLTYLKQSKQRDIARNKILHEIAVRTAQTTRNIEIASIKAKEYWQQVAIERHEFGAKFDKIMNELRNRDCGNNQSQ